MYVMVCPHSSANYPFSLGSSLWNVYFNYNLILTFCLVLIEWEKNVKYLRKLIYIESVQQLSF